MPLAVACCYQVTTVSNDMKCTLVLNDVLLFLFQRLNKVTDWLYSFFQTE